METELYTKLLPYVSMPTVPLNERMMTDRSNTPEGREKRHKRLVGKAPKPCPDLQESFILSILASCQSALIMHKFGEI